MDRAKREQKKFITLTSMINFMMLTLISLLALSCQSEIAAKFPDSLKKPTETSDINAPFITVWKLVEPSGEEFREASRTIILPLVEYYLDPHTEEQIPFNYNFIVDWGDGKTSEITSWDDGDKTHLYENYGTYTVTITGQLEAWSFDSTLLTFREDASINSLIEIKQLGDLGVESHLNATTSVSV